MTRPLRAASAAASLALALAACGTQASAPPHPAAAVTAAPTAPVLAATALTAADVEMVIAIERARAEALTATGRSHSTASETASVVAADPAAYARVRQRIDEVALRYTLHACAAATESFRAAHLRALRRALEGAPEDERARLATTIAAVEEGARRDRESAASADPWYPQDLAVVAAHAAELGLKMSPSAALPPATPAAEVPGERPPEEPEGDTVPR